MKKIIKKITKGNRNEEVSFFFKKKKKTFLYFFRQQLLNDTVDEDKRHSITTNEIQNEEHFLKDSKKLQLNNSNNLTETNMEIEGVNKSIYILIIFF